MGGLLLKTEVRVGDFRGRGVGGYGRRDDVCREGGGS